MKGIRTLLRGLPIGLGVLMLIALVALVLVRIEREVEAAGEIRITRYQIVRPQVPGIVAAVLVEPGTTVKAGQVLCRLVDHQFEMERMALRKQYNEALARQLSLTARGRQVGAEIQPLERARQEKELAGKRLEQRVQSARSRELELAHDRAEEALASARRLREAGLVSDQSVREYEFEKLQAEQRLEQSRLSESLELAQGAQATDDLALLVAQQRSALSELASEREQLSILIEQLSRQLDHITRIADQYTLRAEIDGVLVGKTSLELRGSRIQPGEELFSIIDTSAVHFVTYVPEEAIIRVRAGQDAYVELSGLPKRHFGVFSGRVQKISEQPQLQQVGDALLYPVEIRLEQPWAVWEENRFFVRNGMRGQAKIAYHHDVPLLLAIYESLIGRESLPSGG